MKTSPHRARKRFGQHFLEPQWIAKVVRAIDPAPGDVFVEIGPGGGAITVPLASRAAHVLALEIDRDLARALAGTIRKVTVVEADVLDLTPARLTGLVAETGLTGARLRVAGNLPYNVASPIMFRLAELYRAGVPLVDATLMLQREVADRLLAAVGTRDYGVLTVLLGHTARVERLLSLPRGAFRPVPKILSSLVRLSFHPASPPATNPGTFEALTRAVFTRRRKTLKQALLAYPPAAAAGTGRVLEAAGLDGRRRPETLTWRSSSDCPTSS